MAEAPEIPEANDPYEKRVAISIAFLAVVLSVVGNLGDNAKTDAIIKTNESSNQFAFFQAKSTKGNLAEMHQELLEELGGAMPAEARTKAIEKQKGKVAKYDEEKAGILVEAKKFKDEAAQLAKVNDACDLSCLMLQIGVVVCSVAILSRWKGLWYVGLALGAAGTAWGAYAFTL